MTVLQMFTYEYPYSECRTAMQIYEKIRIGEPPAALKKLRKAMWVGRVSRWFVCCSHQRHCSVIDFIESCLRSAENRPNTMELLQHGFLSTDFEVIIIIILYVIGRGKKY